MGQEVAVGDQGGLSELQARFVAELMNGTEPEEAKRIAGYAESTPIVSILRGKLVESAISAHVSSRMRGDLKLKAMKTLDKLMDDGPATMKFAAAKAILDFEEAAQGDEKPLTGMSIKELEELIEAKAAALKKA